MDTEQPTEQTAWTRERVASVASCLDKIPPAERPLTTAEAISLLAPQLRKLRARGHTLDEIAAHLKGHGLHVASRTLARHLAGAKTVARKAAKSTAPAGPAA